MKCQNCGYENSADSRFCEKCGAQLIQNTDAQINSGAKYNNARYSQNNYSQQGQNYSNYNRAGYNVNGNLVSSEVANSHFDGNMWQLLGWELLGYLIAIVTLGFGIPWAKVLKIRWETKHTVINGKRLYFNGTAPQLFGKLVLWGLLSVVILAIPLIIGIFSSVSTRYNWNYGRYFAFDWGKMILSIVADVPFLLIISIAFEIYIKRWQTKHTTFIEDKGVYNHMPNGQMYYGAVPPTAQFTQSNYNTRAADMPGYTQNTVYNAQTAASDTQNYTDK